MWKARKPGWFVVAVAFLPACVLDPIRPAPGPETERSVTLPELERLASLLGDWHLTGEWIPARGEAPQAQVGTWRNTWILGGRYLQMDYRANVAGEKRQYLGLYTYNEKEQRYESIWFQGATAGRWEEIGAFDAHGRLVMTGKLGPTRAPDGINYRSIYEVLADDRIQITDFRFDEERGDWWSFWNVTLSR